MNIICNNCIGARLYEVTHQQFPNPFMWMTINHDDFIKLVKEYDDIDLNSPKFELERYKSNTYDSVLAILDNGVKLHYIHYIQDDTKDVPVKELSTNILYKDILSYAKSKWFSRLNRCNEKPTFMYSFNYMYTNDPQYREILEKLLGIDNKELVLVLHESIKIGHPINDNITIKYYPEEVMELNGSILANAMKEKIFDSTNV